MFHSFNSINNIKNISGNKINLRSNNPIYQVTYLHIHICDFHISQKYSYLELVLS